MPKEKITLQVLLGFDFGLKRIGVAVGQVVTCTANPLATLLANFGVPDWHKIAELIAVWQPDAMVVGQPLNMDGSEQELTRLAGKFARRLHGRFQLPIYHADERLSSVAARDYIYEQSGYRGLQKAEIDSIAATLILESWMSEYKQAMLLKD